MRKALRQSDEHVVDASSELHMLGLSWHDLAEVLIVGGALETVSELSVDQSDIDLELAIPLWKRGLLVIEVLWLHKFQKAISSDPADLLCHLRNQLGSDLFMNSRLL